jgi:hemerythrin superfamily protein
MTRPQTTQSEYSQNNRNPRGSRKDVKAVDALALLKADHRAVEALFAEFESARKPQRKEEIARKICSELTIHAKLEETSFYPAVRKALPEEQDLLNEAEVEHASLKWLIAQVETESCDREFDHAKVIVLKEYVKHHVKEEEKDMFPKIRKSTLDIKELGQVLQSRKQNLQKEYKAH